MNTSKKKKKKKKKKIKNKKLNQPNKQINLNYLLVNNRYINVVLATSYQ